MEIDNCAIDDISALSDCTALYELYFGDYIIDFSPLVEPFYKFAKKVDIDEDEIDEIRGCGKNLTLWALILGLFPAYILIDFLRCNAVNPNERYCQN